MQKHDKGAGEEPIYRRVVLHNMLYGVVQHNISEVLDVLIKTVIMLYELMDMSYYLIKDSRYILVCIVFISPSK